MAKVMQFFFKRSETTGTYAITSFGEVMKEREKRRKTWFIFDLKYREFKGVKHPPSLSTHQQVEFKCD